MIKDLLNQKIKIIIIISFILGGLFHKNFYTTPHLNMEDIIAIFGFSFLGILFIAYINCKLNLYFFLKPKYLIITGILYISASILPLLIVIISNDKHILDIFFTISSGFGIVLASVIVLFFCSE
jgi:hypothetical protein